MSPAAPDLAARLECLADRLPKFRAALLEQPLGSLQLTTAQRGDVLLRRGDTAHALYVVADGLLRATGTRADGKVKPGQLIARLDPQNEESGVQSARAPLAGAARRGCSKRNPSAGPGA
jgi:CRP-like cAMP-binding protein